ncbi:MAG: DUF4387 domain-containing protein [Deltaproteobacteria bacterium]|nr:DUF4387 domain-containing protein [Deltaproteobacteria bacterium]
MNDSIVSLADIASVIRSKNAGPFILTLDVFFKSEDYFKMVRDSGAITSESMAKLYRVDEKDVLEVTFFEPASALKISIKRWISSAAPSDTDIFGAQQHVPLMSFEIELKSSMKNSI